MANQFHKTVRRAMTERNMTVGDVAKKAKTSKQQVYRILEGQMPSLANAERMAKAVGLKLVLVKDTRK